MKRISIFLLPVFFMLISCSPKEINTDWQTIFNGENLEGWKVAAENPERITVEEGTIKCNGERSQLF